MLCCYFNISPDVCLYLQLLEAVQSVHAAVQSNSREDAAQPPLPPYPDVSSLRLDEGKVLNAVHVTSFCRRQQVECCIHFQRITNQLQLESES